ncbi:3-oxoadipyl-CoA thiolase [Pseudoxanthomonas gei]|uniref:Beta-ketoadipyl-CoA thiolase n=1 Tax=Pseudoxanthomonas gei TaxID=1383030 RepID=A0ABX0AKT1_9GAMM|nr:3-oxoadipyl-CoA thiolase [Pseudoxanthomonas gei]
MNRAYLVDATRTPFGRYGGALAGLRCDDLAALPLIALQARHPLLDWAALDEVVLGCANQAGEDNRNVARMAVLLSGLPEGVPAVTVNRLCGSGLEGIGQGARAIACGEADLVIAGGVESMSRAPYVMAKAAGALARDQQLADTTLGWRFINPRMRDRYGVDSMAQTAEHLAREHHISRVDQDAYALRSQQRAKHAQQQGWFDEEITPVETSQGAAAFNDDEQLRPDTCLDKLAGLDPLLGPQGSITAGNASSLNDGAGAVLLASESALERHGLQPLARIVGMASAGIAPRVMGLGPVPAIHKLLARTRLSLSDFDRIEINEAFAAQVLACTRALGLADDADHVNANGGAIALGHPLGASGARLVMTAAYAMQRERQKKALVSLCVGVGQGLALALEAA